MPAGSRKLAKSSSTAAPGATPGAQAGGGAGAADATSARLLHLHTERTTKERLIHHCLSLHEQHRTSFRLLAKQYGIPYQTLSGRYSGGKTSTAASREKYMRFSLYEEQELERVLAGCMARSGLVGRSFVYKVVTMYLDEVKNKTSAITSKDLCGAKIEQDTATTTISRAWVAGFLTRHPELHARVARASQGCSTNVSAEEASREFYTEFVGEVKGGGLGLGQAGGEKALNPPTAAVVTVTQLYSVGVVGGGPTSATGQQLDKKVYIRHGSYTTSVGGGDGNSAANSAGREEAVVFRTVSGAGCAAVEPFLKDYRSEPGQGKKQAMLAWLKAFDSASQGAILMTGESSIQNGQRGLIIDGNVEYLSFGFLQYAVSAGIRLFILPVGVAAGDVLEWWAGLNEGLGRVSQQQQCELQYQQKVRHLATVEESPACSGLTSPCLFSPEFSGSTTSDSPYQDPTSASVFVASVDMISDLSSLNSSYTMSIDSTGTAISSLSNMSISSEDDACTDDDDLLWHGDPLALLVTAPPLVSSVAGSSAVADTESVPSLPIGAEGSAGVPTHTTSPSGSALPEGSAPGYYCEAMETVGTNAGTNSGGGVWFEAAAGVLSEYSNAFSLYL